MDDIVWTEEALEGLDEIAAYITLDNPEAAKISSDASGKPLQA